MYTRKNSGGGITVPDIIGAENLFSVVFLDEK